MKLKAITCPICKRKLRAYNTDFLEPALAEHIKREHPKSKRKRRGNRVQPTNSTSDFDRGFGIGGLGRHQEDPMIPTVAQMEKMDRMRARATRCRRCGQTDMFHGAMFTTVGGDICDDCCG